MNSTRTEHHLLPVFSLLLTASLWGMVWYPLRLLEDAGLDGLWSSLISYGAVLLAFLWIFVRDRRQLAAQLPALLMLGLAAGWCNVAFILAVLEGNVVRVLLLFYLSPFWAVVLGWFMLDERLDRQSLLVFALAVIGALIMLWNEEIGVPWPRDTADWLAVSSGFGFSLSNVYVRRLQGVNVALKSACSWAGVVLVAVVWIVLGETGLPAAGAGAWLGAVALGLCGFLVMTLAVQYGVTRMPVHRSAVILLFELVVGAVSSQLLTDETVLVREWVGGILIVLAAWLAARIHAGEAA
ncbi:MAG TPA: DMT family transporter [Gammaproteobacteria bacterium]|nr:DMT family transporter [Gammaproteobacteria bacterium]